MYSITGKFRIKMIAAIDVYYQDDWANAALIAFDDWFSESYRYSLVKRRTGIAPYQTGQFYKRELPSILSLVKEAAVPMHYLIIDGHVWLGSDNQPGLGSHVFTSLNGKIPVIGVAKNEYRDTPAVCRIFRGTSKHPLYITSQGIELEDAKNKIKEMHGSHRIPTLLKLVDQLSRSVG